MQRIKASFSVIDAENFKQQVLHWANQFSICCFLDNHKYNDQYHSYEWLLGAGTVTIFSPKENIFPSLHTFYESNNDWLFGHFNYELKNETGNLPTSHEDHIQFPNLILFQPQVVIQFNGLIASISCVDIKPSEVFDTVTKIHLPTKYTLAKKIHVQSRINKDHYTDVIRRLKEHILRGDCYEINFCMEFFATEAIVDPLTIHHRLTTISPNPFSCYYKFNDKYLFCASPERYLKKKGASIISQPIKGTAKRHTTNTETDEKIKRLLQQSNKDRSENVMVVDLVRNDLSRICKDGSVKTEELFGVYTFPQVHQMISTITGELKDNLNITDILEATFPMGSMTGAPKKRVMELIEQYEQSRRGIFSGTVGYITPNKDFDFNVVIRSIMYNSTNRYLSYQVGSGITFYSDPLDEYEECLLKAKAIEKVLN